MTPTTQRKLRDALMGAKVNVTNDELDSWDAWRDHCDVDPAPSLVSTPYSARTFGDFYSVEHGGEFHIFDANG